MESLFATLKTAFVGGHIPQTHAEARLMLLNYIRSFTILDVSTALLAIIPRNNLSSLCNSTRFRSKIRGLAGPSAQTFATH